MIPANTQLTPWPDGQAAYGGAKLPRWDSLSLIQKKLYEREDKDAVCIVAQGLLVGRGYLGIVSRPERDRGDHYLAVALPVALGVACWLARSDGESRAARGLVGAMVIYNLGVAMILGVAGIRAQTTGVALWPAVALHAAMTIWCIMSMLNGKPVGEARFSAG